VPVSSSVARRYARALLMIAQSQNQAQTLKEQLNQLGEFFGKEPELLVQILSPALSNSEREKILKQLAQGLGLNEILVNFLYLLNQKRRLDHLSKIQEAYLKLMDEEAGIARARVMSAWPLSSQLQEQLVKSLEKKIGKKVIAEFELDRELIGGLKVQVGSLLLDGSVLAQLKSLEGKLKST